MFMARDWGMGRAEVFESRNKDASAVAVRGFKVMGDAYITKAASHNYAN